jgi:hypothetical protein
MRKPDLYGDAEARSLLLPTNRRRRSGVEADSSPEALPSRLYEQSPEIEAVLGPERTHRVRGDVSRRLAVKRFARRLACPGYRSRCPGLLSSSD